jgi:hypothetical protein
MKKELRVGAFLIASLFLGNVRALAQQCHSLQTASVDVLVSYLGKTTPSHANAACIALAINELGTQKYEPAIPALTRFLDFRWPVGAHQKQRLYVLEHDGETIYPAAAALEQLGKKSLPAVLNAMKSDPMSPQAMEVAVSVWMTIYKDQTPTAVGMLKQVADNTKNPVQRQRLGWAAYIAATGWCSPADQAQCRAAVQTRY